MSSKSRLLLIAAATVVALVVAGYFAMQMMMPPDNLDVARVKSSANGIYSLAIDPEAGAPVQNEMHAWVLTVKDPAGAPVTGASVSVDGGMPQHGHGLPTSPKAAEIGQGRYRIEGVRFNMSGWWELKFTIVSPMGEDDVVFNISL